MRHTHALLPFNTSLAKIVIVAGNEKWPDAIHNAPATAITSELKVVRSVCGAYGTAGVNKRRAWPNRWAL
jgi:hypothetical protein